MNRDGEFQSLKDYRTGSRPESEEQRAARVAQWAETRRKSGRKEPIEKEPKEKKSYGFRVKK